MVPTVFIYPIVLLAMVWLFLMLHAMWSSDSSVAGRPLPRLVTPTRKRSHAPKPFAGLTYKPHCAACEQREYTTALLAHFGQWVQPPRRQAQGPVPKPRWMPVPELLYAQVVKQYRRRRLVQVSHRVVFGTLAGVKHVLAPQGWQINTAFIERVNLTIRQHVAAVGRRVITLCKGEAGARQQLALYHMYYNFTRQ